MALYGIDSEEVTIRRFGRNDDFTGYFTEETVATPEMLNVRGRESVMIVAEYREPIAQKRTVNEVVCYGDKTAVPLTEATFTINVPQEQKIEYAELRVGLVRPPELSQSPVITLNGNALEVPLEDCADRLTDREYATTKLVQVNPADLQAVNTISVSFVDGTEGFVGSAVIRAAVKQ